MAKSERNFSYKQNMLLLMQLMWSIFAIHVIDEDVETDVTLYAPNDLASISKKHYGIKNVEEWGYVPYVTWDDLKQDHHVFKRYYHKCEKCGNDEVPFEGWYDEEGNETGETEHHTWTYSLVK